MSELPEGIPRAEPPSPRGSAIGIVLRCGPDGGREVLLGVRSRRSRFMPGHLAFPGGRLEEADAPGKPGAYARCVAREVEEETGLKIPPQAWSEAGERITPPMFAVRFHTRFFVATAPEGWVRPDVLPAPEEIESLTFAAPRPALDEWARGASRIPPPVLPILRILADADELEDAALAGRIAETNDVEQRAPRIEFERDIWMLPVATATLPPATHTNVWMPGAGRFAIVDPGSEDPAEIGRLLEVIERRTKLGQEAAVVLLTHGHRDHVGGASRVAEALGIPIRAHPEALRGLGADEHARAIGDDTEIDLDGLTLRALHTPGHAPGHLAFHIVERGALIAGDLISGMSTILIDPEHGDMDAYLRSLDRVCELDLRVLYPGHGPPLPGREAARLIAHRGRREEGILAQLSDGAAPLSAIARGAYTDVPEMPPPLVERQVLSHLLRLERLGRVSRADLAGRSWRLEP